MGLQKITNQRDSAGRIEFLDSIRGLAALAVLLSHGVGVLVWSPAIPNIIRIPLLNAAFDGKAAVAMFFVLSGFVLSRPYLTSGTTPSPRQLRVVPFYIKRIARIFIPFLSALVLSVAAKLWWFRHYSTTPAQSGWFLQFWNEPLTLHGFLKQCLFLVHDARQQLLNQDWSLGIELKASALLPLLLLAFRRGPRWLLVIGCALLLWRTGQFYVSFILGILLAAHLDRLVSLLGKKNLQWALLCAGLLFYQSRLFEVLAGCAPKDNITEKITWTLTSLGCALILLTAFSSQRIQKVLNHAAFVFLGRISYGVYLLQFIILLCIIPWLVHQLNGLGLQNFLILVPIILIASSLLTIATATVFYVIIEQPGIQLGHHFASAYNRRFAPKPKSAPAGTASPEDTLIRT